MTQGLALCLRGFSVIKIENFFQSKLKANDPYKEIGLQILFFFFFGGENVVKSTLNTSACVLQPVEKTWEHPSSSQNILTDTKSDTRLVL